MKHSAYRSMKIAKEGKTKNRDGNLRRWINEDWRNLTPYAEGLVNSIKDTPECGKPHPEQKSKSVCRPLKKVSNQTPELATSYSKDEIKKAVEIKNNGETIKWSKLKGGIFTSLKGFGKNLLVEVKKSQIIFTDDLNTEINAINFKIITFQTLEKNKLDELYNSIIKQLSKKYKINGIETATLTKRTKALNDEELKEQMIECEWYEMPDYTPNKEWDNNYQFYLMFKKNIADNAFNYLKSEILDNIEDITDNTKTIWYPPRPQNILSPNNNSVYVSNKITPKYPIYVISKGRWKLRHTVKWLEWCDIDYKIVIRPDEYDNYSSVIDKNKILTLTKEYLVDKDGKDLNQGGIPARNFCLFHSKKLGFKRHWILDDNIDGYTRLINNERILAKTGAVFKSCEDYVDRYQNILLAGHQYNMFGVNKNIKPLMKNTRIFSSILIDNSITDINDDDGPLIWRGKYNEDVDLSIRVLKLGYPTALFTHFLAKKLRTMNTKGGNTDTIYAEKNAHKKKAEHLKNQHPDIVEITYKFNRIHHSADLSKFKNNKFIWNIEDEKKYKDKLSFNNYTMKLVKQSNEVMKGYGTFIGGQNYNNLSSLGYPLGDDDIKRVLPDAKIIDYEGLKKYSTIDELLPNNKDYVIILYENEQNSGHWVCVIRDGNTIEFFCSYGTYPDHQLKWVDYNTRKELGSDIPLLSHLFDNSPYEVIYNEIPYQSENKDIATCGKHCVFRIRQFLNGLNLQQYQNLIKKTKPKKMSYDEFINNFYDK